jgi:hypothetical protein
MAESAIESAHFTPHEGNYTVTPAMARIWLSQHNYRHQRRIRAYHVDSLSRMMEQGRFRKKTQINFMRLGSEYILTNGQHTLSAIEKSGKPQLLSVIVNKAECDDEVADDYARHDTHLTRQHADSLIAHEVDKHFGVTPTQLNKMSAAAIYYAKMIGELTVKSSTQITHDEKHDLVMSYGDLALKTLRLIEENTTEAVPWAYRKTTMAAIMFCLDKQPDIAVEFWSFVVSDDGLAVGDPRKTLRRTLSETMTPGGRSEAKNVGKTMAAHEFIKSCAACWNAFLDRRELRLVRVDFKAATTTFKRCGEVTP